MRPGACDDRLTKVWMSYLARAAALRKNVRHSCGLDSPAIKKDCYTY